MRDSVAEGNEEDKQDDDSEANSASLGNLVGFRRRLDGGIVEQAHHLKPEK